jgi:lysophospholipase L1-like esterase
LIDAVVCYSVLPVRLHLAQRAAFRILLPFLLPQGLWVRLRAPRFAPATGPRAGSAGAGETVHLLAIGDSIVEGVGVKLLEDAMPGRLASALASALGKRVEWVALGVSGMDAGGVRHTLIPKLPRHRFDFVFVSVGVNDVTRLRTTRHWRRELTALVGELRAASPDALIVVSGLPPLHGFPLLPQPLRWLLGMRARTFDSIAAEELNVSGRALFVPNRFEPEPGAFALDGYHPSERSCRIWAETVVSAMVSG